uniref:Uncharacterized protein n=1 Tax=Acrobeloides nanus TaxID=290746 RepID=A0A914CX98_9BILA
MAMWVYFSVLLLSIVTIHAKSFMMIIECDENKQDISRCSINVPNLNESHREDPHNLERALKERVIEDKLKESRSISLPSASERLRSLSSNSERLRVLPSASETFKLPSSY